ncbi:hypothetical protein ACWEFL_15910 [Streptomyces sp. NPDC004838]
MTDPTTPAIPPHRSAELAVITEALQKMGPHTPAARIWGRAPGAAHDQGAEGNVWAGDAHDVALHICTRLYGRPDTAPADSPLAQAEDAQRRRSAPRYPARAGDIVGEPTALTAEERALASAPWYPARPGDIVHVAYEQAGSIMPAFGETYAIEAPDGLADSSPLLSVQLLAHSYSGPADEAMTGYFTAAASDHPLYELWHEAGPQRLTIVRDGLVVHNGPAGAAR